MSLCECGCGQVAPISSYSSASRGYIKGQPRRFIRGHNSRGALNNNWNYGRAVNADGYVSIRLASGEYEYEHRLVLEQILGRALGKNEVVHHIDGNRAHNAPSNLTVMSRAEHARIELSGRELTAEHRNKISAGLRDAWASGRRT